MKKGYQTSEFWVTNLAMVGALSAAFAGALPPKYAAVVIAVGQASYAISRGLAKVTVPNAPEETPAQLVPPAPGSITVNHTVQQIRQASATVEAVKQLARSINAIPNAPAPAAPPISATGPVTETETQL